MLWDRFRRKSSADEAGTQTIAASHPLGYSGEIELALISAVYSAPGGEGEAPPDALAVRVVVDRWHRHRDGKPADNLSHISGLDDYAFKRVLADEACLGGRPRSCVVQDAADGLLTAQVFHAADVAADPDVARQALRGVRGLDEAGVECFLGLLGVRSPSTA